MDDNAQKQLAETNKLTPAQKRLISMRYVEGLTNSQIAARLRLREHTVRTYFNDIMRESEFRIIEKNYFLSLADLSVRSTTS